MDKLMDRVYSYLKIYIYSQDTSILETSKVRTTLQGLTDKYKGKYKSLKFFHNSPSKISD